MGGVMYGVGLSNSKAPRAVRMLQSQLKILPYTPNDKTYRKVSVQRAGSLDYGRGSYAGTGGHNRFDEKYLAVV